MSDLLPAKKDTMKSIRFKQETIEFIEKIGPVATVARAIIEKAIKNWDNFESINLDDVGRHGSFKRYSYGGCELDGLTVRSCRALFINGIYNKTDIESYLNHSKLTDIDGVGVESATEILEWLNS